MKNIFISGVSKGIGYAIMKKYIKAGYHVYGTYNSDTKSAKKIKSQHPNCVTLFKVDFKKTKDVENLIQIIKDIKFNAVVNNAGMIEFEDFNNFDMNIWDDAMNVNLKSILLITLELSKNIRKNGSIVNISSTDGNIGSFASMSYAVSKAALTNLTKSLGNNLGLKGIRVNSINPGWIDTNMSTKASMEASSLNPLGRNGRAQEIAEVVYFLTSTKASYINGASINVDGGYTNVDYIMKKEAGY